jgi:transposase
MRSSRAGCWPADLALLADLEEQIAQAEAELAELVPASPFRTLISVPGWE